MIRSLGAAGLAAAMLNGCAAPATQVDGLALRPDSGGLAVEGTALRIDFGRTETSTLMAVEKVIGPPRSVVLNEECGAGPTEIVGYEGIDLLFLDDAFRGWVVRGAFTTANGLTPGMTLAEVEAAGFGPVEPSTLGFEFGAGGVYGLFPEGADGAPIELLWAGTSCFFR